LREGKPRVLIVGGGVAALETLLALRALAWGRSENVVLCPDSEFAYAPLSVIEPFELGEAPRFDLAEILNDLGAEQVRDTLAAIDCAQKTAKLGQGGELGWDVAVITAGAKANPAVEGALTFRGSRDREALAGMLDDLESGEALSVAFVVPSGVVWPLPLYELALLTSERLAARAVSEVELSLVTSEQAPLRLFGRVASDEVVAMLARHDIHLYTSRHVERIERNSLISVPDGGIPAERAVAAPRLVGHKIPGLPHDPNGFLRTDGFGLVEQTEDVYAAGDVTSFPVKQGGIATQQADALASAIAARLGAQLAPSPFRPVLRGLLISEEGPSYLRAEIAGGAGDDFEISRDPLWRAPGKIVGRYLSDYLAERGLLPSDASLARGRLVHD
jgi:sulfide:quinone oxidoreductase